MSISQTLNEFNLASRMLALKIEAENQELTRIRALINQSGTELTGEHLEWLQELQAAHEITKDSFHRYAEALARLRVEAQE